MGPSGPNDRQFNTQLKAVAAGIDVNYINLSGCISNEFNYRINIEMAPKQGPFLYYGT